MVVEVEVLLLLRGRRRRRRRAVGLRVVVVLLLLLLLEVGARGVAACDGVGGRREGRRGFLPTEGSRKEVYM